MINLFNSDFYRLRKSASFRNTIIGLIILTIFVGFLIKFMSNTDGLVILLDEYAQDAMPSETLQEQLSEFEEAIPDGAAGFIDELLGSNILALFLLPLIITIFAADFTAGTFRNTLSYESNRKKVYLSKLLLSTLGCLILTIILLITSWITGGLFFGFSGITPEYIIHTIVVVLLLFPVQMGIIGFGHCVIAFTRKSSSTTAIYILTLIFLSLFLQVISMLKPFRWIVFLDWQSAGKLLVNYTDLKVSEIITIVASGAAIAVITSFLGITRYEQSDMA